MNGHGSYRASFRLDNSDLVETLLTSLHDDCRAGYGDSGENCTARRELLESRARHELDVASAGAE
jgi:hypothetical protein